MLSCAINRARCSQTAVWYRTGKPPVSIRWILIRDPPGKYKPIALLSTDTTPCPIQIANWFVCRWQMEVTFEEVRAHLGVETQRQWSDKAIAWITPNLIGIVFLGHRSRPLAGSMESYERAAGSMASKTAGDFH